MSISSFRKTRVAGGGRCRSAVFSTCAVVALWVSVAQAGTGKTAVDVTVLENSAERIVLSYTFADYSADTVLIGGREYTRVSLDREAQILRLGAPDLPNVCRSVIIPDTGGMTVNVVSGNWYEIEDIDIAPSKGNLLRDIDPEDVPYTFGDTYAVDAEYPGDVATLGEPYILRDHRGIVVRVNPFQYNPVARRLRVCTDLTVEIVSQGSGEAVAPQPPARQRELSLAFHQMYKHHFLNYQSGLRYDPLNEVGEMLVICYDAWLPNIQPLVDHKNSIGINTTAVGVSTVGNNANAIAGYIEGVYDTSDLAFVLLVGDAAQVATPYASGGSADPTYALVDGNDHYPDILVGRFSAEDALHVDTQVERTISYESMPATAQDWFWKGVGIGSSEGTGIGDDGESDTLHIANIRNDLLNCGYTQVDGFYGYSATSTQVANAVNAGRGIINYCGHGSTYAWSTTGFSTTHVNALVNDNMLPFIVSVACVNGQFAGYTCFAEAWLRATHNGVPTGAIGMYASSINQSWAPPMCAQDETVDLLCAEAYFSFGALCFAGSCQMMDEYGRDGYSMFDTWHVFGDPSVRVVDVSEPVPGDLDRDGDVDLADLGRLLANYGMPSGATYEDGDIDGDGDVDLSDLAILLANYG